MAPSKWDSEDEDSSSASPSPAPIARRRFEDEEEDDSDVLESWDAAEDSEVEREKAKKAEEAKAKAVAAAKASHKTKSQRIAEKREQRRLADDEETSDEEEDDAIRRARVRKQQKDADLAHAEDLFGDIGVPSKRSAARPVTLEDPDDSNNMIDPSKLKIFNPTSKDQFNKLRDTMAPLIAANSKRPHYVLFLQEFYKQLAKELSSNDIKKLSSGLTTLSNEKMKEEKAAEKGGKKSKAAKNKSTLNANRNISHEADTSRYDDDFGDDDFM